MNQIKSSGFTLIEFLITFGLGTFILMASLSTITVFWRSHTRTSNDRSMLSTADTILQDLTYSLQTAQEVSFESEDQTLTTTSPLGEISYHVEPEGQLIKTITPEINPVQTIPLTLPCTSVESFNAIDRYRYLHRARRL